MDGFQSWLRQLDFSYLLSIIIIGIAAVLSITVHETCHGLMALALGDDTAKRQKRLSLNPLRHIDPIGLVLLVLVRFGWAKPVPIDPRKFRHPKRGMVLTALAGPLSNVLLALVARALWYVLFAVTPYEQMGTVFYHIWFFIECVAQISAGLAVFNLIPIPPLDGSKVLFAILPTRWYSWILRYERYGMILLMALLLLNVLDVPLQFLRDALLNGINAITEPLLYLIANG